MYGLDSNLAAELAPVPTVDDMKNSASARVQECDQQIQSYRATIADLEGKVADAENRRQRFVDARVQLDNFQAPQG